MTQSRAFKQVDVFTSIPFLGNPVAVVLDGAGLSDAEMLRFANWTNLSETTFVIPATNPDADYALRIWTPQRELPFAGHPTLGTGFAVLEAGLAVAKAGRLVQQCEVGLVELAVPDDWHRAGLSFRLPRYAKVAAPEQEALAAGIGGAALIKGTPAILDVGPRWVIGELTSDAVVAALTPNLAALAAYDIAHGTTGLTVFAETHDGQGGILVRSFAPTDGLPEDPVCGSGNGAIAAYRLLGGAIGEGAAYTARQGAAMRRDGFVKVQIKDHNVHIGGACVTCVEGAVRI